MGGRALRKYGVETERKSTKEFNSISNIVRYYIDSRTHLETAVTQYYRNKPDHGDLDILVKTNPKSTIDWKHLLYKVMKATAVDHNGNVYSFDFNNFQVDIILISEDNWEIAQTYFSNDPIGNIVGKTFHKFGLSYGWDGLKYKYRNIHNTNTEDILISKDSRKIFEFGGYDYDRFLNGFDSLVDIFQFIIDSKYFNADIFQMENMNSIDRKRNNKRVSYHVFLKYLKKNKIESKFTFERDKSLYLEDINNYFPEANLVEKIKELDIKNMLYFEVSLKFNAFHVMIWFPELKGKYLGVAIGKFKNYLGENYNDFILNNDIDTIKEKFVEIYGKLI